MKLQYFLLTSIIMIAVLISGCTSQPAAAPATPAPAAPAQGTAAPAATSAGAAALIGTHWQLGWFDDTNGMWSKVVEGSTITAKWSADGKLRGFSGCADYITDYQFTETPKVWIKRPPVSEKICQTPTGVMKQESHYYTDLASAETYELKNGQLLLFDKTGKRILQFDPAP